MRVLLEKRYRSDFLILCGRLKELMMVYMKGAFVEESENTSVFDNCFCLALQDYVAGVARTYKKAEEDVLWDFLNAQDEQGNILRLALSCEGVSMLPRYVFESLSSGACLRPVFRNRHLNPEPPYSILFKSDFLSQSDEDLRKFIGENFKDAEYVFLVFSERFYADQDFQRIMTVYFSQKPSEAVTEIFLHNALLNLSEKKLMLVLEVFRGCDILGRFLGLKFNGRLLLGVLLDRKYVEASLSVISDMRKSFPDGLHEPDLFLEASCMGSKELLQAVFSLLFKESISLYGEGAKQALLLQTTEEDWNALEKCIQSQNSEGILFLLDLYLRVLTIEQIQKVFCQMQIRNINRQFVHLNFFHLLGFYVPALVPQIYARLEECLKEPLHHCLVRLNFLGKRALDLLECLPHKQALCEKIPREKHIEKVLVLDIDGTLLVKKTDPRLRSLTKNRHYVEVEQGGERESRYAYFRRSAMRAIILWVMHHPGIHLYVVTKSGRDSQSLVNILCDITGASEVFILSRLDGYFSGSTLKTEEYGSFLNRRGAGSPLLSHESGKHLPIEYLLTQEQIDLSRVEVCFYEDRQPILDEVAKNGVFAVKPVLANLISGKIDSLVEVAEFCGIHQPFSRECPEDVRVHLEPLQIRYRQAIEADFLEEVDLATANESWVGMNP